MGCHWAEVTVDGEGIAWLSWSEGNQTVDVRLILASLLGRGLGLSRRRAVRGEELVPNDPLGFFDQAYVVIRDDAVDVGGSVARFASRLARGRDDARSELLGVLATRAATRPSGR